MSRDAGVDVAREAHCFARYLIRRPATDRLVARYREALEGLGLAVPLSGYDRRMLAAAGRHPLVVEALDTAAAVLDRQCLLRRRLFVLAGLMETDSDFTGSFFEPPPGRPGVVMSLVGSALRAGFWLVLGAPVLWVLRAMR